MKRILFLVLAVVAVLLVSVAPVMAQHSSTLNWIQSSGAGVTGNNVYRGTTTGGPYTKIFTSVNPIITYTDTNVLALATYYYVVTATCATCSPAESGYSNEVKAVIPGDPQPPAPTGLGVTTK